MLRLFSDGGCIWDGLGVGSRSTIGGTYAWALIGEDDRIVAEKSGVIEASTLGYQGVCTNNVAELYALAYGIMHVPEGSDVHVYSDSQCALGRIFKQQQLNGVPDWLWSLTCNARDRIMLQLGRTPYTMVAGHPTLSELKAGVSAEKRDKQGLITRAGGMPVDKHNKYVDAEADRAGKRWIKENKASE